MLTLGCHVFLCCTRVIKCQECGVLLASTFRELRLCPARRGQAIDGMLRWACIHVMLVLLLHFPLQATMSAASASADALKLQAALHKLQSQFDEVTKERDIISKGMGLTLRCAVYTALGSDAGPHLPLCNELLCARTGTGCFCSHSRAV